MGNRNLFPCTGFTSSKCYDIAKVLSPEFINDVKLAVMIDGVLYSHAGARQELFSFKPDGWDIKLFLNEIEEVTKHWRTLYVDHRFLGCGRYRGGDCDFGGLTWCDFNGEFYPSEGLPPQIVGHTKGDEPRSKGQNWCIDCRQTYYAIVTDGKPEFKKI